MKNKISDLRDHLFAQLERLGAEDISDDGLKKEISRSCAMSEIGKVIVESAKTEVMYAKLTGKRTDEPTKFLEEGQPKEIERAPAEYSNKTPLGIAK